MTTRTAPALPANAVACEVQAMMDAYFGARAVHPEARKLIVRAALLRRDWMAAEARCMERHLQELQGRMAQRVAAGCVPEGDGGTTHGSARVGRGACEALTVTDRAIYLLCNLNTRIDVAVLLVVALALVFLQ